MGIIPDIVNSPVSINGKVFVGEKFFNLFIFSWEKSSIYIIFVFKLVKLIANKIILEDISDFFK